MAKASEKPGQTARIERPSDCEVVVTRHFDAAPDLVFEAWARPELFSKWWIPQSYSMTLVSCDMDVRTGGKYRLEIGHPASDQPMAFFGTYLQVEAGKRIAWTNEETPDGAITTVTFTKVDGGTKVVISNLFPSAEALEQELGSGAAEGVCASLDQLQALLLTSGGQN